MAARWRRISISKAVSYSVGMAYCPKFGRPGGAVSESKSVVVCGCSLRGTGAKWLWRTPSGGGGGGVGVSPPAWPAVSSVEEVQPLAHAPLVAKLQQRGHNAAVGGEVALPRLLENPGVGRRAVERQ